MSDLFGSLAGGFLTEGASGVGGLVPQGGAAGPSQSGSIGSTDNSVLDLYTGDFSLAGSGNSDRVATVVGIGAALLLVAILVRNR